MNRREFLQRLGLVAAAAAAPKFIFDYGANLYKANDTFNNWEWIQPYYQNDPFRRYGYYFSSIEIGISGTAIYGVKIPPVEQNA